MERLTQYTSGGVAESYIGEADNLNIYEGGMEGKYISGRQITKLSEYEDTGLTPQEIKKLVGDNEFYAERYGEYFDWKGKAINREKELEVYKRALYNALEECKYIEIEENVMPNFLEEARKELENE